GAGDARDELRRHALVGVDVEDPGMAERDVGEPPILVRGPVVERALRHRRSARAGDLDGAVPRHRVVNVDVVRPRHGVEAARQVLLLVFRQDQDRDHADRILGLILRAGTPPYTVQGSRSRVATAPRARTAPAPTLTPA